MAWMRLRALVDGKADGNKLRVVCEGGLRCGRSGVDYMK